MYSICQYATGRGEFNLARASGGDLVPQTKTQEQTKSTDSQSIIFPQRPTK